MDVSNGEDSILAEAAQQHLDYQACPQRPHLHRATFVLTTEHHVEVECWALPDQPELDGA